MKHEWRKHEKELYLPKDNPTVIEVPALKYLTIQGEGNPNEADFAERTAALYALSYGIRMLPKQGIEVHGYQEYTVYPLEGDWTFVEGWNPTKPMDKSKLAYIVMIRQPDFVSEDIYKMVLERVAKKKPQKYLEEVKFVTSSPQRAVQILHKGPYDDEAGTFAIMKDYMTKEGLEQIGHGHREVYLSDPRKVAPEKMKTVLRYPIKSL